MLKLLPVLLSESPCIVKHPVSVHCHHCVVRYWLDGITMHGTAHKYLSPGIPS